MNAKTALFAIASLAAAAVTAAPGIDRSEIQAQYKADRNACLTGQTMQADRNACLYDARLVREAALAGRPVGGEDANLLATNVLQRCDGVPTDAKDNCLRVMNGEAIVTGSVEQGLILREPILEVPVASVDDLESMEGFEPLVLQ